MCDISAVHEPSGPPRSSERRDWSAAVLPPPRSATRFTGEVCCRPGSCPMRLPRCRRATGRLMDQTRGGATWRRSVRTSSTPAHRSFVNGGCFATPERKGSSAESTANGARFSCFTRLCPRCGKAQVTIDGDAVEELYTHSADDIWSAGPYAKTFTRPGKPQMRIAVTGERGSPRAQGALVHMPGVRIE